MTPANEHDQAHIGELAEATGSVVCVGAGSTGSQPEQLAFGEDT
jgi:hypothetical protein